MKKDIRNSGLYREAEALCSDLRRPGTGQISDAADLCVAADGSRALFAGAIVDKLEGSPPTRICSIDLSGGDMRVLTFGPNTDKVPKFSPDGCAIAFLSDRHKLGDFQLYLLDPISGAAQRTAGVEGWVEYFHWSPDGKQILLGVAGHGADIAGGQGAIRTGEIAGDLPSWIPSVETTEESYRWRRLWVYELSTNTVRQLSHDAVNVWEAVWCGNNAVAAVTSPGPSEGLWYTARLHLMSLATGASRELYASDVQLGALHGSPGGQTVAFVEAICSDRWYVAGDVRLIDVTDGKVHSVDTHGVDVAYTEWRSEKQLLLAGHRGFETVVGLCDVASATFTESWVSAELSTGGIYAKVSGFGESGDFALIAESFTQVPEIAVVRGGRYQQIRSFATGRCEHVLSVVQCVERIEWRAPDGLHIQGWLLRPKGSGPHPVLMNIHGGPVYLWRPTWLGRGRSPFVLMLIKRGYAVFFPNPRGSTGRGQDYVRHVRGDMGGADTYDYLSGLDHLVERGIADPKRLGVTGGSYGGFMTSWLITQDARFAAAIPMAPVTNQVTEHLVSNIPHFTALFLADHYTNPGGKYFQRSPVMHAHKVKTPTLNICGALDRCTPPEEAVQFHNALVENGVESVLVIYPEEGHGIRKLPATLDYAARVVDWLETHLKPHVQTTS